MLTEENARVRALCERKGLRFRPWEIRPWEVDEGPSPYPSSTAGHASWSPAQRLRRRLLAELEVGESGRAEAPGTAPTWSCAGW